MLTRFAGVGLVVAITCATVSVSADDDRDAALACFTQSVAPVLAAKCVSCHGPNNPKGGLDLTTREALLRGGDDGPGLSPGQPDDSPILRRTISQDGQRPEMPEKGEPLTAKEAEALGQWIAAGAPWPDKFVLREPTKADANWWSFQQIAAVEPPGDHDMPAAWAKNPIDRFIHARLRAKGLSPNPPADPRAFLRRATFDLTGLPPTPEEVAAFVRECQAEAAGDVGAANGACERLINRLLDSPQYGERWGRHWLDVVRFGESRGYERNEIITNLWPFRDYIIRSFNEDKPFDRLVLEHLAGDVIGKDQPDIEIGSAFLVAGPYDDVGNQDVVAAAQIRADQMDEMIRATGEAFLGLTIGCARCHDHKFDPLLARDYYALYATFAGTVHGPREVATETARQQRAAQLQPLQEQRARHVAEQETLERDIAERAKQREAEAAAGWPRPRISRYGTEEVFEPVDAKFVRLTVEGSDSTDPKQTRFRIDEFEVWTDGETPRNVALAANGATAVGAARDAKDFGGAYSAALVIDGKFGERWHSESGDLVITLPQPERIHRVLFSSDRTKALGEDHALTVFVGDYRIEVSQDGQTWTEVASSADRLPPTDLRKLARLTRLVTTPDDIARRTELAKNIAETDANIARVPALPVWWVGTHQAAAGPYHTFLGGSPQRKGEEVFSSSLQVLSGLPSAYSLNPLPDEGARRLALARWLTSPDQPLTPRVLANRVWQHHFGTGIVDTPNDFGSMGGRPSHPGLLDWLARELLRSGWQLKPLHRLMMTSQTYRQSAAWREVAAREDGDSRLLWRFPPRRLSAEEIRDTLLSVAGKLDPAMGGPGFRLYEYQQDNVATYVPLDVHGPETYRRSVYHHNARAARVDVMSDFDCPDPVFSEARRASTTTPLQALTLMNHGFSVDMTRAFAERLTREGQDAATQVRRAFQLAFAREPSERELAGGVKLIETHGLAAFCRAVLNSNELIHVN
ncbi:MAG: DUF1553 domain-containing protein [Planctomycetaceae bacterium]|nr:DUF1553 domain-containing protein [Planctomycetaceae bacterium]